MLGKFWRSSKVTCQYPEHSGDKKRARGRAGVNLKMDQHVWKLFGVVVPTGSGSFVIILRDTVLSFFFSDNFFSCEWKEHNST